MCVEGLGFDDIEGSGIRGRIEFGPGGLGL